MWGTGVRSEKEWSDGVMESWEQGDGGLGKDKDFGGQVSGVRSERETRRWGDGGSG